MKLYGIFPKKENQNEEMELVLCILGVSTQFWSKIHTRKINNTQKIF